MYGVSFNTTVGDWAVSGEYVYRPNLPTQVSSGDLLFALVNLWMARKTLMQAT